MKKKVWSVGLVSLMAASVASAALIVGQEQFTAGDVLPSTITAVAGDLLETSVSAVGGDGENANAAVRNGTTGTAYVNSAPDLAAAWRQESVAGDPAELIYTLDTTGANSAGYDIAEIRIFSGWDNRASQDYDIYYSVVGNADFVLLGSVLTTTEGGSVMTRTYDDTGAAILTGVDQIQLFLDDEVVYREFDVIAIPEPATLGLVTAFAGGILFIRRRFMM